MSLGANAFFNGTNWIYKTTQAATRYEQVNGQHQWSNAPSGTAGNTISFTQAMTLDASGNLGIGTSAPAFALGSGLEVERAGIATLRLENSSGSNGIEIAADSTTNGIRFYGLNNAPFVFAPNATERARITSGGDFLVGATATPSATVSGVMLRNPISSGASVFSSGTTNAASLIVFFNNNGQVGRIDVSGTATSYVTSSDRRLKENIIFADDAGAVIDAIEIVKHDWKSGGHVRFGMIAQDLHQVAPEAVSAGDDGEEIEKTWGVDYSKLVPMLVKEIQSLRARVAQLETK
jgi:hypothetical protein